MAGSNEHVLTGALVGVVLTVERHVVRVTVGRADALTLGRTNVRPTPRLALTNQVHRQEVSKEASK